MEYTNMKRKKEWRDKQGDKSMNIEKEDLEREKVAE